MVRRHLPVEEGASITGKVNTICRQDSTLNLAIVLHQLNEGLRGWTTYFRRSGPPAAIAVAAV